MKKHKSFSRVILGLLISCVFYVYTPSVVAQSVAQGYSSDSPLQIGMMVRQNASDSSKVDPITQATANKLLGVVVAPNDVTESISQNNASKQFYVATNGSYHVLVSTQNGTIHAGDYIVASSISGVGMEQDDSQPTVVGIATTSFTGKDGNAVGTATVKNSNGKSITIELGYVTVTIKVATNPQLQTTTNIVTGLPSFLRRTGQSIANKPVSDARVYLGLLILAISAIIAGSMLYAGVRNGMVAIGRNPLAKKSIVRNLLQVIFTSLIVFVIGLFAVYLLLKL